MTTQETTRPAAPSRPNPWAAAVEAWSEYVQQVGAIGRSRPALLGAPADVLSDWVDVTQRVLTANLQCGLKIAAAVHPAVGQYAGVGQTSDDSDDHPAAGVTVAASIIRGNEAVAEHIAETERVAREQADQERARVELERRARERVAHENARAEEAQREKADEVQRQTAAAKDAGREPAPSRGRYTRMKKADLVAELARRGLPQTGRVPELVDRLVSADADAPA